MLCGKFVAAFTPIFPDLPFYKGSLVNIFTLVMTAFTHKYIKCLYPWFLIL